MNPGDRPKFEDGHWSYAEPVFEPFPRPGTLVEVFSTVSEIDLTQSLTQSMLSCRAKSMVLRLPDKDVENFFRATIRQQFGHKYAGWRYLDIE